MRIVESRWPTMHQAQEFRCRERRAAILFLLAAAVCACEADAGGSASAVCQFAGDGTCDEPEGTGLCAEGTDPGDCGGNSSGSGGPGSNDAIDGSGGTNGAGPAGGSAGSGAGSGKLGATCSGDPDCDEGLACVLPAIAGDQGYCGNACKDGKDDCYDLAAGIPSIQVPLTFAPMLGDERKNFWNAEYLYRGVGCFERDLTPGSGAPKFCHYICPDLSAMVLDDEGWPVDCACLPGYRYEASTGRCEQNPDIQCNILDFMSPDAKQQLASFGIKTSGVTCDACNSNMDIADDVNCHTSRFMCDIYGNGLEGRCTEVFSIDEFMACKTSEIYTTCDCNCPSADACGASEYNTTFECACCDCKNTYTPPPKPVCEE